jgi:hypothetical protein
MGEGGVITTKRVKPEDEDEEGEGTRLMYLKATDSKQNAESITASTSELV